MTIYEKKRRKTTLTKQDVANQLNINFIRYDLIERGKVKMPTNLIDKFNEIINKKEAEQQLERLNREKIVNEWFDEISQRDEKNDLKLMKKMKDFNIKTYTELAKLMGYSNVSGVLSNFSKKHKPNYRFKNRLYSFFESELNIQPIDEKTTPHNHVQDDVRKWYQNTNLKEELKKIGKSQVEVAREIGIGYSTLSGMINKRYEKPYYYNLDKLKKYLDKLETQESLGYSKPLINTNYEEPSSTTYTNETIDEEDNIMEEKTVENIKDEISKLQEELEEKELLEKWNKIAKQQNVIFEIFMNAGFTRDEAMTLLLKTIKKVD